MNGLYGIWCKLCALFNIIAKICDKTDEIVMNNEELCTKIETIVGDPDAPCPECDAEAVETPLVEAAQEATAAAVATTVAIKATAVKLQTQFARKTAEKGA